LAKFTRRYKIISAIIGYIFQDLGFQFLRLQFLGFSSSVLGFPMFRAEVCRVEVFRFWGLRSAGVRFSDLGLGCLEIRLSIFKASIFRV